MEQVATASFVGGIACLRQRISATTDGFLDLFVCARYTTREGRVGVRVIIVEL
jgi:hypothetical protein